MARERQLTEGERVEGYCIRKKSVNYKVINNIYQQRMNNINQPQKYIWKCLPWQKGMFSHSPESKQVAFASPISV